MLLVLVAVAVLVGVSRWYANHLTNMVKKAAQHAGPKLPRKKVIQALVVLALLVFSKYIYMASLQTYYTFFLIEKFHLPVGTAQLYLFLFLASVAAGTFAGGPIGDKIGRKRVIWFHGIDQVYRIASFLPLLGIMAALLPKVEGAKR